MGCQEAGASSSSTSSCNLCFPAPVYLCGGIPSCPQDRTNLAPAPALCQQVSCLSCVFIKAHQFFPLPSIDVPSYISLLLLLHWPSAMSWASLCLGCSLPPQAVPSCIGCSLCRLFPVWLFPLFSISFLLSPFFMFSPFPTGFKIQLRCHSTAHFWYSPSNWAGGPGNHSPCPLSFPAVLSSQIHSGPNEYSSLNG